MTEHTPLNCDTCYEETNEHFKTTPRKTAGKSTFLKAAELDDKSTSIINKLLSNN